MEHIVNWVNNLMDSLESEADNELSGKIIEKCGRVCANECGAIKEVDEILSSIKNETIDDILEKMNAAWIGGGKLKREDNFISGVYDQCYCPSKGLVKSKNYCNCTKGWVKEVFERILNKPVNVTLEQTIAGGDKFCKYRIDY